MTAGHRSPVSASAAHLGVDAEHWRSMADELTWCIHSGDMKMAAELLQPLSLGELRALAVALATARRPRWTLKDDGAVDEIAVLRAAAGEPVPLTRRERDAAALRIIAAGGGPSKLATSLHLSGQTAKALYRRLHAVHAAHSGGASDSPEPRRAGGRMMGAGDDVP